MYRMNIDLEGNVQKHNKLDGCVKKYFGKNVRREVKLRKHDVIAKPALQFANETWAAREEEKGSIETFEMELLRPVLRISLRATVRKQLGTERVVEEVQQYQRKWNNRVERMPPERLPPYWNMGL
jgi:hypothetical protein